MPNSQSRALAQLLAGFADRQVSSPADLDAWARDSDALVARLSTEFFEVCQTLSEDEWWFVQHFLDDADIRLKEPASFYTKQQVERLRQVIAKLEAA